MNKHSYEQAPRARSDKPANSSGVTRRDLLKQAPLALAAGSLAASSLLGSLTSEARAGSYSGDLKIAPKYYPLRRFRPEVDPAGKLAVITGASWGILQRFSFEWRDYLRLLPAYMLSFSYSSLHSNAKRCNFIRRFMIRMSK